MAERFRTLSEIRRAAKNLLPPGPYGFAAGGAETETTLRRNRSALDQLAIRQRVLVDVREIDLSTTFLGLQLPLPVAVAPMGGMVLFHPEGDCEIARGAGLSGNLAVVSGGDRMAGGRGRQGDSGAVAVSIVSLWTAYLGEGAVGAH